MPNEERTLAFTANGLQTSYAKVARGCFLTYILIATVLDRLLCQYWVFWVVQHKQVREALHKSLNETGLADGERARQNTLTLKLVMRTWEERIRLGQQLSLVAWRNYCQVRNAKGKFKRSKLDDAFQRDVALQSVQTYAGQHQQLQENVERLKFLNEAKEAQIDKLKLAVVQLQAEELAASRQLAHRNGQIDQSELLASQLEESTAANRRLQQQCLELKTVATDEKAKVAECKERQRMLETQLSELLETIQQQQDQQSSAPAAGSTAPEPSTPEVEKTKVTLAGGRAGNSHVGGRWILPTVGVASYRSRPQEASPQVVQAPVTPTPEVEDQIKRLETEKSEALRLGDYKRAHILLKQLEQLK